MKKSGLKGRSVLFILMFALGAFLMTGCPHSYSPDDEEGGGDSTTAPVIQSTSPANGATRVGAAAGAVSITFNQDIKLGEGSGAELTDAFFDDFDISAMLPLFSFGTKNPAGEEVPALALVTDASYASDTNTLTLKLDTLAYSTEYFLTVDGVYGLTGLTLGRTVVSFTTAAEEDKVVSVGAQTGALTGYAAGTAVYEITTVNVDTGTADPVTWYDTSIGGEVTTAPAGVTVSFGAFDSGKAELSVVITDTTPAGTYYFSVTFDGEESDRAALFIRVPEAPNYGTAILPEGSNIAYIGNSVIKDFGERIAAGSVPGVVTPVPAITSGTVYYVSPDGSDSNNGTSPATAWASIQKVNSVSAFNRGDQILFRAGGRWELGYETTGPLSPKGSGITIGAYGSGPKPQLVGITTGVADHTDLSAIFLHDVIFLLDQEDIEIRDLDIQNNTPQYTGVTALDDTEKLMARDRRGIHITVSISTTAAKALKNYTIKDCYIHNVLGSATGVSGGMAWDVTKRGAGLIFETVRLDSNGKPIIALVNTGTQITIEPNRVVTGAVNVDTTGYQPAWFENITIEKNVFRQNAFSSITFKQLAKWGVRADSGNEPYFNSDSADWRPHKNVVIQDNYIDHFGWERSADGIYCTNVGNGIIRRNAVYGCGTSAIEMYNTDSIVVERNEVYEAVQKVTGADSNAIDPDRKSTNILIQYNYVYNSNEAILLCEFSYGNVVVRYNVLKDNGKNSRQYINLHGDKGKRYIYNNVFYHSLSTATRFIYSSGGVSTYFNKEAYKTWIYNNVFYSPNATGTIADGTYVYYSNNWYGGTSGKPSEDSAGIEASGDPGFINLPGLTGGKGRVVNLDGLMLTDTSQLRGTGADIEAAFKDASNNHDGTLIPITDIRDLNGTLVRSPVDIGVFRNAATDPVEGVDLNLSSLTVYQGRTGTLTAVISPSAARNKAVTWETSDSSVATITGTGLTVTINGLAVGTADITVRTADGGFTDTALVTVAMPPLKTITGTATATSGGAPVEGATVTISDGGGFSLAVQTGSDGTYSIANVPAGDGYSVTVTKAGYETLVVPCPVPIEGTPAPLNFNLISSTHVYYDEPFDNLTDWTVTTNDSAQLIEIITDPDNPANKLLHINKGSNNTATFSVKNSTAARAYGVFTYETRWKRSYSGTLAGQYQIYTNEEGSSDPVADIMMDVRNIYVHGAGSGSSTRNSLGTYEADTWYALALCVNTATDTFRAYVNGEEKLAGTTLYLRNLCDYIDFFSIGCGNANYAGYGDWWVDYIKIYQGEPQFTGVSGVNLDKAALSLSTTGKGTLSALITPPAAVNRGVTWESNDTDVATVSGTGSTVTINGVAPGIARITVRTDDGGYSDSIEVTVGDNLIPVTGVSIVEEDFSLAPTGTKNLTAIVSPSEAAQSVTWSSGTPGTATVAGTGLSGTVTGVANGTSVITASAGTFSDTVTVTVETISYAPVSLVIKNQAAAPAAETTADNPSLLQLTSTDGVTWSWTGTATVTNAEVSVVGNSGIGAYTFGYVDYSLDSAAKYIFTAKIALTAAGNLMVADFTNPGGTAASGYMNFMGMRSLSGAAKYYYGAASAMSAPESGNATLAADTVYTFVITFTGTNVAAKIMNADETTTVRAEYSRALSTANTTIRAHVTPRPGFAVGGPSAEGISTGSFTITISELKLTLVE